MRSSHSLPTSLLGIFLAATALCGCDRIPGIGGGGSSADAWKGVTPESYARANEHRLLGLAYLENSEWNNASQEFQAVQKALPNHPLGYLDLAATYSVSTPPHPKEALEAAQRAVELSPNSAWAKMLLGKAYQSGADNENATRTLEEAARMPNAPIRVLGALANHLSNIPGDYAQRLYELRREIAQKAPDNVVAQADWLLAQAEKGEGKDAEATLDRMLKLLPAIPETVQPLVEPARSGLRAGGRNARVGVMTLRNVIQGEFSPSKDPNSVWARSLSALYGNTKDPADLAVTDWQPAPPALAAPALPPVTITWKDVTAAAGLSTAKANGSAPASVGDVLLASRTGLAPGKLGEYRPDLVVGGSPTGLFPHTGKGFRGAAGPLVPGTPLLLDLNNDFASDLYVAAPEGDRLWINTGGKATNATFRAPSNPVFRPGANPSARGAGIAVPVDLDQDGDLDVIRVSSAAGQPTIRYLRNNGNLTFTDLTKSAGLQFPSQDARHAVAADFDGDGDPDLFIAQAGGPSRLFLNQRQDLFRDGTETWGLKSDPGALSAAVADFDRDGKWDLVVAGKSPHGSVLYHNTGAKFEANEEALGELEALQPVWIETLDYDNDSWIDLAVAGPKGVHLLRNDHGKFAAPEPAATGPASWVTSFDYDQDGDLDLLVAESGSVKLFSNEGANARKALRLSLQGLVPKEPGGEANNTYAIGATVQVRTPWDDQRVLVTGQQTLVGLGVSEKAISARVIWTHGVPLHLLNPQSNQNLTYAQTTKTSCPFLYAWDGEKWSFATDFNWKSPLGMRVARGKAVPHDQTLDWVKIPTGLLKEDHGSYYLSTTEELREISYFDMMRLVAVDHPSNQEIYLDERFHFGPSPPYEVHTVQQKRLPRSARNEQGQDLLSLLEKPDFQYTPVPTGPYRGVLAPHDLILDLGQVSDPARIKLFLYGWVRPAAPSTNIAISQNPKSVVIPPTLSVGDGKGGWREIDRTIGLPCGKYKTIVLNLGGKFTGSDFRLKLTTTTEIRWDSAFFTSGEQTTPITQTAMLPASAELRERGYGRHYRDVPDGPDLFDYNDVLTGERAPSWTEVSGTYTKLGECQELLQAADDQYAIIAPGDELRLRFDARRLPPLRAGWKRDFVFMTDGWTKDSDPNTVTGESVEPLPFHGMKRYPYGADEQFPRTPKHQQWRREWLTRTKGHTAL